MKASSKGGKKVDFLGSFLEFLLGYSPYVAFFLDIILGGKCKSVMLRKQL